MQVFSYTAIVEYDPDTKLYVGTVPSVVGAHSQGETLDELHANLREVVILCLEEAREHGEPLGSDTFVGLQKIDVAL